jgi:hypothetical protein
MKTFILIAALGAGAAQAATPESYAALEARVAAACGKASGFDRPTVSPTTVRFSDRAGVDARLVTGIYPQPHMKRAQGLMLCLYERGSGRVEVQDAESWWTRRKG